MIAYLLKSVTCLGLLLAFYHLVLEREKMHNFNRFYLLGSVLFSFLAPLYVIYIHTDPIAIENILTPITNFTSENISSETLIETPIDYTSIFITIYFIISSILLIRFGRNLINIIRKTKKHITINYKNAVLVLVEDKILPHTFWNFIFINKQDYQNKKIEQELFTHELTHVSQKHTLDVLILELIQSIFWINPFFILLKKTMQLNHEFLADEKVIKEHKNTFQYQHLLLNKAAWKNEYYLASNLNYSLTKKRLKMMTTQSSPTKILLKKLAIIPLLTGFLFLFAKRVEAQEEQTETIHKQGFSKQKESSDSEIYKEYDYQENKSTINKFKELINSLKEKDNPLHKYNKTNKYYEVLRNKKPHYIDSDSKRKDMLEKIFSELGSMYFKLTKENKQKVKRPIHPHDPYLRLMKNNKVFYKLRKDFTEEDELLIPPPPPVPNATKEQIQKAEKAYKNWKNRTGNSYKSIPLPPPPRHHLDQVIEMAKKGAKFYYEGKSIDSDKAIKLLKTNKKLSIHSESTNNSNYKVWISKSPIE